MVRKITVLMLDGMPHLPSGMSDRARKVNFGISSSQPVTCGAGTGGSRPLLRCLNPPLVVAVG